MLRRLIVVTALAAGMGIAAVITLATPAQAKGPSQARKAGSPALAWLIASVAAVAVAALASTGLLLRHRKPAAVQDSEPRTSGPAAGSA